MPKAPVPAIINAIITYTSKASNQEKLIQYLREVDFKFVTRSTIKTWKKEGLTSIKILRKHKRYSFMLRELKHNVGDRNEFDFRLVFGFKMNGKKVNRLHIYLNNKFYSTVRLGWKDADDINFRKMKITLKFPDELEDYTLRRKWRVEHLKLQRFPEKYTPSEFYLKWLPHVTQLEPTNYYHGSHDKK